MLRQLRLWTTQRDCGRLLDRCAKLAPIFRALCWIAMTSQMMNTLDDHLVKINGCSSCLVRLSSRIHFPLGPTNLRSVEQQKQRRRPYSCRYSNVTKKAVVQGYARKNMGRQSSLIARAVSVTFKSSQFQMNVRHSSRHKGSARFGRRTSWQDHGLINGLYNTIQVWCCKAHAGRMEVAHAMRPT